MQVQNFKARIYGKFFNFNEKMVLFWYNLIYCIQKMWRFQSSKHFLSFSAKNVSHIIRLFQEKGSKTYTQRNNKIYIFLFLYKVTLRKKNKDYF